MASSSTGSPCNNDEDGENIITQSTTSGPPPPPFEIPIKWPPQGALSIEWVESLAAVFDWSSRHVAPSELPSVLPVSVFDSLAMSASKILHREPNCLEIDVDSNCSVVVVGDVHGQLHDVLNLLQTAGPPSPSRLFVFNGDYVDRGAWGLETFLLLLAWKVHLPHRVFLLRGNHESKFCTAFYGFEQEVMAKYGDQGKHIYRKCLGCFEGLPLASIIAGCVYTAHGGLFRNTEPPLSKRSKGKKGRRLVSCSDSKVLRLGSLGELARARRVVLDPPWEGLNLIPGDVLWSDPSTHPGLSPNKERGIGLLWGPDCTEEFLNKNHLKGLNKVPISTWWDFQCNCHHLLPFLLRTTGSLLSVSNDLISISTSFHSSCLPWSLVIAVGLLLEMQLIIRSHEGPDAREKRPGLGRMHKGYTIDHDVQSGKLITVFSAPDYPQFQASMERYNNRGAYIILEPPDFANPNFHTFEAVMPRPKVNAYYDYENVIDSDEELDLDSIPA